MSTAACTRGDRPRSSLVVRASGVTLAVITGLGLLACRPAIPSVSTAHALTPAADLTASSMHTASELEPESALESDVTPAEITAQHSSPEPDPDEDPSTSTTTTTAASASTDAAAPPPSPAAECAIPQPTATWAGRQSDDEWARGLYPAMERYPAGMMALTFDDGPHPSRTAKALDLLAKHELSATFFLTGFAIKASTYHLVKRMAEEGHTVANHGWRHDVSMTRNVDGLETMEAYIESELELTQVRVDLAMMARSAEDFAAMDARVFDGLRRWHDKDRQLEAMPALRERHQALLQERGFAAGERPVPMHWVRPPGGIPYMGRRTVKEREAFARVLNRMGLRLAMWNGGTGDSSPKLTPKERRDPERIAQTARRAARRGGIYVAHDRMTLDGTKAMITALARSKAEVVSLDRLERAKHEARGWCGEPETPGHEDHTMALASAS